MTRRAKRRQPLKRLRVAAFLAVISLAVSASPSTASITIGQLPSSPGAIDCFGDNEWIQPSVTSGTSYVVPATGTITSWSHNAKVGAGQALTMKVFRPVAGSTYMAVGRDARPITSGVVNTFSASIPVRPGDVLGLHVALAAGDPVCLFLAPGDAVLEKSGNVPDGASEDFPNTTSNRRLNLSAVVNPSNAFSLGTVRRNKKRGTATLTVEDLPNPGELTLAGKGVKSASATGATVATPVTAPGDVELTIRAKGKKKRKLKRNGKVKIEPLITYTPTGGDPSTQSRRLKLKKR